MKKILLLPGWMRSLKLSNDSNDLDIRIGKLGEEDIRADYVIGVSLGALVVLQNTNRIKGKIILINPLLPKRSLVSWFINCVRHITAEGLLPERQKFTRNPIRFFSTLLSCIELLGTDFSETLDEIPREKIVVIRGKNDRFYCDEKAVEFIKSRGIRLIEVDGGHNWSEAIEKALRSV